MSDQDDRTSPVIVARCVSCRATKEIDAVEAARLSRDLDLPMCDRCGCVMYAESVRS